MRNVLWTRILLAKQVLVLLLVCALATNSGCVTTLGYLPDDIKPEDPTRPTYKEVVKWGTDLKDGYGSRASGNRSAIYGGAIIAAAAVSAMTGLATFNTGGSTILGIGLGTGFLASAAAIYSNDLKAKLYDNASSYMDKLLIRSQVRLWQRQSSGLLIVDQILKDAQVAQKDADQKSTAAKTVFDSQTEAAKTAHAKADAEVDDAKKKALNEAAQSIDKLVATAKADLNTVQVAAHLAEARVTQAQKLGNMVYDYLNAKDELEKLQKKNPNDEKIPEKKKAIEATGLALKDLMDPEADEAQCLRGEIRTAIDKVTAHLEDLTPQGLVNRFNAATSFDPKAKNNAVPVALTGLDFSDLKDLETSACPILEPIYAK